MPQSPTLNTALRTTAAIGLAALCAVSANVSADVKLNGSGASFPFPIYSKWFKDFSAANKGVRVDYQSKGSGAGIQDLINGTVDFAGIDAAMSDEEMAQVKQGVVLLPMTAGEIVLIYNLKGVDELKLPRDVYPAIFAGKITKWNDPKIAAANPGVRPAGQGHHGRDPFRLLRHHLCLQRAPGRHQRDFKTTVGQSKSPQWPKTGKFVTAPKNDGVTAPVKQTEGSIGYIEYGFAKLTGSRSRRLENQAGTFVAAGAETGAAALAAAEFPPGTLPDRDVPDLRAWIRDPAGDDAYPIVSFTWMLFYQDQDEEKAKALRKLVEYGLTEGQKIADSMGYIPLPANVVEKVREVSN